MTILNHFQAGTSPEKLRGNLVVIGKDTIVANDKDNKRVYVMSYKVDPSQKPPAIDMTITWQGTLSIVDAQGGLVKIATLPRTGDNLALHQVGATYSVLKLVGDPPHWSDDGH